MKIRALFQREVMVITGMEPMDVSLLSGGHLSLNGRVTASHNEWRDRPWLTKFKGWFK